MIDGAKDDATPGPPARDVAQPDGASPAGAASADPAAPGAGATRPNPWPQATLAIAAFAVGMVVVTLLVRPPAGPQGPPASDKRPAASSGRAEAPRPDPRADSPAATRWRGGGRPVRASDGSRAVTFELDAEDTVPVWMKRVRPVLTVRCLAKSTDAFVVTDWPASIEPDAGRHTVRISFDEDAEVVEQWADSEDRQALFAPDGIALARRIARARTLRFGFTPHNAPPVVVAFDVNGFDELVGAVARSCRWKP